MNSNAVHFITSGIAACCLCMYAEAAGAKADAVEKTAATSVAKVDAAAKTVAETRRTIVELIKSLGAYGTARGGNRVVEAFKLLHLKSFLPFDAEPMGQYG